MPINPFRALLATMCCPGLKGLDRLLSVLGETSKQEYAAHEFVHPFESTDLANVKFWTTNGPYVRDRDPAGALLPRAVE